MPFASWFPWWSVLVDLLVAARLTRLATRDALPPVRALRTRLVQNGRGSPWTQLWVCAWCMSPWVAALVLAVHLAVVAIFGLFALLVLTVVWSPLAASYVVGLLADREAS